MRITSKTVHDINKMEDNFALRYVFTYPGIISCAELVPSHGASRRRLGDNAVVSLKHLLVSPEKIENYIDNSCLTQPRGMGSLGQLL